MLTSKAGGRKVFRSRTFVSGPAALYCGMGGSPFHSFSRAASRPRLVLAALSLLLAGTMADAWDSGGHEIVATIAYERLNSKARQAVTAFATQVRSPVQTYDAITLACWMDDLRKDPAMPYHGQFPTWHYIDLPLDSRDPRPSFVPGSDTEAHGDVVQALKRALVVLNGGTDPYVRDKAMACALVLHLVGDIHQPLHCATKYFFSGGQLRQDLGGNRELVINAPPDDAHFNLHAFWDSAWRAFFDDASGNVVLDPQFQEGERHHPETVRALAAEMEKTSAPPPDANLEPRFDDWALESNAIARTFVYPEITATDNRKYCRLSSVYVARAQALARQRLVLAGWRLAALLNATLGAAIAPPVPPSYPAGPADEAY
jgi:hypothetical protein